MATYISRHQPRRQTVIAGQIRDPNNYGRFYDLTCDALAAGALPTVTVPAGGLFIRYASAGMTPAQVCGIHPAGTTKLDVRFSGRRLDGRAGQGAIYLATPAASLRELTHYSLPPGAALWTPGAPDRTAAFMAQQLQGGAAPAGKVFYLVRTTRALRLADLRPTALWSLVGRMMVAGGTTRYGISENTPQDFLARAHLTPDDYSASRGIADAVADRGGALGLAGVLSHSARADRDDGLIAGDQGDAMGGLVVALFGQDGERLSALEPALPPGQAGVAVFGSLAALRQALGL